MKVNRLGQVQINELRKRGKIKRTYSRKKTPREKKKMSPHETLDDPVQKGLNKTEKGLRVEKETPREEKMKGLNARGLRPNRFSVKKTGKNWGGVSQWKKG